MRIQETYFRGADTDDSQTTLTDENVTATSIADAHFWAGFRVINKTQCVKKLKKRLEFLRSICNTMESFRFIKNVTTLFCTYDTLLTQLSDFTVDYNNKKRIADDVPFIGTGEKD